MIAVSPLTLAWLAKEALREAINHVDGFHRAVRITAGRGNWAIGRWREGGCDQRPLEIAMLDFDPAWSSEDARRRVFDELRNALLRSQVVIVWTP